MMQSGENELEQDMKIVKPSLAHDSSLDTDSPHQVVHQLSATSFLSQNHTQVGIKGDPYVFKGMKLQKEIVTSKEYQAALENGKKKN